MRKHIEKPRILLIGCALEFSPSESQLASFDSLLVQEQEYLTAVVDRISELSKFPVLAHLMPPLSLLLLTTSRP